MTTQSYSPELAAPNESPYALHEDQGGAVGAVIGGVEILVAPSDLARDGWTLFFDGTCEPINPGGIMGWGWVLYRPGEETITGSGAAAAHPRNTGDHAEYLALVHALRDVLRLIEQGEQCHNLLICGDSKPVVCQMMGTWKCNAPQLAKLRDRCLEILKATNVRWLCEWIPRDCNRQADALSHAAHKALAYCPSGAWAKGAA
jgi:ribonuclease HI